MLQLIRGSDTSLRSQIFGSREAAGRARHAPQLGANSLQHLNGRREWVVVAIDNTVQQPHQGSRFFVGQFKVLHRL